LHFDSFRTNLKKYNIQWLLYHFLNLLWTCIKWTVTDDTLINKLACTDNVFTIRLYYSFTAIKLKRNSPRYGAISRVSMRKLFPGMGFFVYFGKVAKTNPHLFPGWVGGGLILPWSCISSLMYIVPFENQHMLENFSVYIHPIN
jgi:hypothetical protein